ncbi:MAG: DUF4345 domain-containing protein, partial [Caldilinea sp.]|nr:DUF4345 domain-containing protein [Caldilinea sp.]
FSGAGRRNGRPAPPSDLINAEQSCAFGGPASSVMMDSTNLANIMRAIMGLYFGMIAIWLWGAFSLPMAGPALVSCAVFMLGLAAGRTLSFVLDGMPHWLLVVYAVIEVVLGTIAILLYRIHISTDAPRAKP